MISKEKISEHNNPNIPLIVTIEELKEIYLLFDRPLVRAVIIETDCFISFNNLEGTRFKIQEVVSFDKFAFIEKFEKVNLDNRNQEFLEFFFLEFWQGKSWIKKILHFIYTISIVFFFNLLIVVFSTEKNILNLFLGLLSAVSIFVAVFSVFTASHDQLNRKKPFLFQTGKIAYYFSVDRNLTIAGFIAILACLFGIAIVKDDPTKFVNGDFSFCAIYFLLSEKGLVLFLINLAFIMTFITLRSLIEFYISRPAKYIMGELKDEFFKWDK